jgi:DNA-binding transcriptional ArsR family regulator
MNIQEFEYKADNAATLMKSLGSRPRLMLLCHLVDGEKSVGRLAELTGLRMTAVSQNLALLRAERIVSQRRDGTTIHYRLSDPTVRQLIRVLYRAFCEGGREKAGRLTRR